MKTISIIYLLLFSLLFISCNSSRRLSKSANQAAQLSEKIGFKVKPKDDLRLYTETTQWLGTPYRYGGTTRKGIDCSGLVNQIYKNVYQKPLERTSTGLATKNCRKVKKGKLSTGDLVFFNTSKKRKGINHVGLFLKDGYFVHASTSKGVIISNLNEEYYRKTWKQGGKVK